MEPSERTESSEPASSGARRRSRDDGSSSYQPRGGGESSSGSRPRSGGGSSGYRRAAVATTPQAPRRVPNAARRVPPGTKAAARKRARRAAARAARAPVATPLPVPAATGSSPAEARPAADALPRGPRGWRGGGRPVIIVPNGAPPGWAARARGDEPRAGPPHPDPAPCRGDRPLRGGHPRRSPHRRLLRLRERPAPGHVARGLPAQHHHPGLRGRRQRPGRVRDREAGGGRLQGHPARAAQRHRGGRGRGLLEAHRDQPLADPGRGPRQLPLGPARARASRPSPCSSRGCSS